MPRQLKRPFPLLLFLMPLLGLIAALYGYLAPLTGVTGTLGALLAIVASLAIALSVFGLRSSRHAVRTTWVVLMLVLIAGTLLAGLLLHEWWLCAAMGATLLVLGIHLSRPVEVTFPRQSFRIL